MKRKQDAYVLWLISLFGWLGLHHFYLNRYKDGFISIITLGGLGYLSFRSLLSLSSNVDQFNLDYAFAQKIKKAEIAAAAETKRQERIKTHIEIKHKESVRWAVNILKNKEHYLILDTETTGLGKRDVVIQLAIINLDGLCLFDSTFLPTQKKRISSEATGIHGLTIKDLQESPSFLDKAEEIYEIIKDKIVLIYNSEFDERLIFQTCVQDSCPILHINSECVMKKYSQFKGKWSDYRGDFVFQKLPGGDHSALGDCKATLKVIEKMTK